MRLIPLLLLGACCSVDPNPAWELDARVASMRRDTELLVRIAEKADALDAGEAAAMRRDAAAAAQLARDIARRDGNRDLTPRVSGE